MKVRGSWAQVGNDTQPYIINTAYSIGTSATANGKVYSLELPSTVYDSNLKPERKNAWEVGLDWRFVNNRITWILLTTRKIHMIKFVDRGSVRFGNKQSIHKCRKYSEPRNRDSIKYCSVYE
jgi:hypothetical protein